MEEWKTRSREREPCCFLICESINLTAVPHFLKVSSDTLLDRGFYLYPSQTWAFVWACACVARASVWSKQSPSWLRHDSTWGCLPSPPYFKASIYPQDWLFWLTKAQESQCTTCYAAEVCQASNTCSPFRCLFHYSSSLPLSPGSRGTFVYASDFFPLLITPFRAYLDATPTVFYIFHRQWPESELICSQVWSGLQSWRLDFLSLV